MNTESNSAAFVEASSAPEGSASETGRRPRLGLIGVVALLVVLAAALAGYLPRARHRTALKIENQELAIPTVTVAHPAPAKSPASIPITAEIRPYVEAPLYARANGYLKRWLVDLGAEVKAGQLLAEIDTPELNQELAQAKAQLLQAEAALELAKTTAARWADLLKSSSVSAQEAAEKQADLALKTATVEAARANVGRLEDLQSFARVTAPFAGTITARRADTGELIQSNKELFRLAQTQTLRVYAHVPQSLARGVAVGQKAEITIPELPRRVFEAKVVRTSGAITAESRTLLTELELPNPKGEVLAGSFAQVRFPEAQEHPTLTVPGNAVIFRSEGTQLALVHDGQVELRNVTLGRDHGHVVEILSGVDAADSVILNPADSLVTGMKVRVAAAQPEQKTN
jgi:RND family efflux transporter MFP subunit